MKREFAFGLADGLNFSSCELRRTATLVTVAFYVIALEDRK